MAIAGAVTEKAMNRQLSVWDSLVRITHWAIVVGFATAYLTEDDLLTAHVWAGYTVGIAVTVRIIWGFVGPKHARFIDFLYGPAAVVSYLLDLLRFRSKRYIGHSPAGGAMVIALLLCLVGTVVTGLALYGAEKKAGPLRALYAATTSVLPERGLVVTAAADENRRERRGGADEKESVLKGYHEVLANITLGLVIIHILAVLWASIAHRENLVGAMITGRKRSDLSP
jgi:cytochrome b